jgi:lipopolysaccharide heptosyltransferase III
MSKLPPVELDCIHFKGDRPCFANKNYGVFCDECTLFERDETLLEEFPQVGDPDFEENPDDFKKIIIIKLDAVGDVLRTTSILPSLKKKYTDSSITWITKEKSFDVLKDNEKIDEIYFDTDDLEHIYNDDFDIALNLDSGIESCSIMARLIAKERFGYTLANGMPYPVNRLATEWYLMGVDDNRKKKNTKTYHRIIHEICSIEYTGSKPRLYVTGSKIKRASDFNTKYSLGKYDEFIIINLGGGNRWQYKKWIKEGYISLINAVIDTKPETAVGIIAGSEDRDFYEDIAASVFKSERILKLGCGNSTDDFICFIYLADKVFTSDSLAMHIATALDKYTVVITGPTSYTELDVFGNGAVIHSDKVDCLCCYLNTCDKTVTCMNTVNAEDIVKFL